MTGAAADDDSSTSTGPVVVGVDGSEPSRHALQWAAYLADQLGTNVQAVTAWDYPPGYGLGGAVVDWSPAEEMRTVQTNTLQAVFGEEVPPGLTSLVAEGGAARVLLDASRNAAMVIVGSRGHGGFTGLLLGSVSASVAEHARCPVLVVHGDQPPSTSPAGNPKS